MPGLRGQRIVLRREFSCPRKLRNARAFALLAVRDDEGGTQMAWNMTANMIEFCSCKALCPCWLGPDTEPDQGWCSGALVFEIKQGAVDGLDVSGCKAALAAEWPGNFFGGRGTARLYIDAKASEKQRGVLE